jgi:UDPglucose 6-dehydrogenase
MDLKSLEKNYKNENIDYIIDYKSGYKDEDVIMIAVGTPEISDESANLDYIKSVSNK